MAASVIVDASFLVALLNRRETDHRWAADRAQRSPPPWKTCEAVLSEAFFLLGPRGRSALTGLLHRRSLTCDFHLSEHADEVLALMQKYEGIPMSLADACLVRMTELLSDPILLTADSDFRTYRRHGRQVIPTAMPDE